MDLGKKDTFREYKKAFEGLDGVTILEGELLGKLQKFLLGMLKDVIDVCERHQIFYTLSGGSVLGAVRHKGFIPWDDDIDLNMPRKDFEKFKTVFESELGDKYTLCTPEQTSGHGMSASQIKRKGTRYVSFNELSKEDSGICIDIFVVENTFDNKLMRNIHGIACLAIGYLLTCRKTYNDMPYLKQYTEKSENLEKLFGKKEKIGRLIRWIPLDTLARKTMQCYSACKNDHSVHVSIPTGKKHYFGEMYLRSDLCESVSAQFEDVTIRIPKGWDKYMRILYGEDYMEMPPEEKWEHHPLMVLEFEDTDKVDENRADKSTQTVQNEIS